MSTANRASSELWTAATAAAADRHTIDRLGIPSPLLMERAALCVAHEVAALRDGLPVVVLCGPGNNGGDGLAVARQLFGWEIQARAVLCTEQHNDAVAQQLALCHSFGVTVDNQWPADIGPAVVVDALLGTGGSGPLRGGVAEALLRQRGLSGPRVAVDLPTGLCADTGTLQPSAFVADLTVTFVRSKPGLHVMPGRASAGRVVVADIGLSGEPDREREFGLVDPGWVGRVVTRLPAGVHKGERGHLGVVGGSAGTTGAAVLAAAGGLRAGVGLVTIATRDPQVHAQVLAQRPEVMVAARDDARLLPGATALCVGPGLASAADREGLAVLWRDDPRPAVWDAGALDAIGLGERPCGERIVTPHPGEAARILARAQPQLGWTSARVQAHRIEAARALADCTGAVAVLKGEATLVAVAGAGVFVVVSGGSALATAGSGDVLAGVCGALLARGVVAPVAAQTGAYVHGIAGEHVAAGAVAMDIADAIGPALSHVASAAGRSHPRWPSLRRG